MGRVQARVGEGKEGNDRRVVAERDSHTRKKATNKWAVDEMFDRVFSMVTKNTRFGVSRISEGGHPPSSGPGIQQKFNKDNECRRLNFFMDNVYAVDNAMHNMSNGDFELEKRILPRTEAYPNVVDKTSLFERLVEVRKLFKNLLLGANRLGLR